MQGAASLVFWAKMCYHEQKARTWTRKEGSAMRGALPLALLLALGLSLSGCSAADPAQQGEVYCRRCLQGEGAQRQEDFVEALTENWAQGGQSLSQETAESLWKAYDGACSRLPIEVELLSQEEKQASLRFTVGSIDLAALDAQAAQEALDQAGSEDPEQLWRAYEKALCQALEQLQPQAGESFEADFVQSKGGWQPAQPEDFAAQLAAALQSGID